MIFSPSMNLSVTVGYAAALPGPLLGFITVDMSVDNKEVSIIK